MLVAAMADPRGRRAIPSGQEEGSPLDREEAFADAATERRREISWG